MFCDVQPCYLFFGADPQDAGRFECKEECTGSDTYECSDYKPADDLVTEETEAASTEQASVPATRAVCGCEEPSCNQSPEPADAVY